MTKRSQRHALRSQSGCMWSLLSLFDFRGRSTAKLLMGSRRRDGKHGQKVRSGGMEIHETAEDDDEDVNMPVDYAARRASSVKDLMAAEMITEQLSIDQLNDGEDKSEKRMNKKRRKKRNRNRSRSSDMDVTPGLEGSGCSPADRVPEPGLLNNLDLKAAVEELGRIALNNANGVDRGIDGNDDSLYGPDSTDVKKLVMALKQLMINNGNGVHSEEFADALEMLIVNKGVFLKLLRDQNSALVAHFEKLVNACANEGQNANSDFREEKQGTPKLDEFVSHNKHWNLFRRSKSVDNYFSLEWDDKDYISSNRIVLLKPNNPAHSLPSQSPNVNQKNVPFFSFTNFKRKLRNAMGKERQPISPRSLNLRRSQSGKNYESFSWSSPNRNHFYTERFAIFSSASKHNERGRGSSRFSKVGGSDINTEAKKHLSDVLKNGEENAVLKDGQRSKSLGRILSFPDHKGLIRPENWRKYGDFVITPEMRSLDRNSTNCISQDKLSTCSSPRKSSISLSDKAESPENGDVMLKDDKVLEVIEIEDPEEPRYQEEEKIVDTSSKGNFVCIESDLPFLQDSSAPKSDVKIPSSPCARELNDSYHAICKTDRPSPVSVLDSSFTDGNISPASTVSPPVEKEILPRQIQFEEESSSTELGACVRISSEDVESAFEYVEAVLLGSGLNWDEFLTSWLSSSDILDSSLFQEVELFSSQPHNDQKLLFDCTNEELKEVCDAYFSVSGNRPNIRPIPKGMDLINDTWKRVEKCMVLHPARSLDELVKIDMETSGSWMELRWEVEVVGSVIGDAVVDELVEGFVVSLLDYTSL